VRLERLGKLKKSNELMGIRTHVLPACSIVPQPTMLLHAPDDKEIDKIMNTKNRN
jgi:hypothetical protein